MKKILLLILLLSSLNCFSQINRTIWGCTLGKSTKQQVHSTLMQKGFTVLPGLNDGFMVMANNISFGGGYWTSVSFYFVNSYLSKISFQKEDSITNINDMFMFMKDNLDTKYLHYNYGNTPIQQTGRMSFYSDGVTSIDLVLMVNNLSNSLFLDYGDELLNKQKKENEIDEL